MKTIDKFYQIKP